MSQQFSKDVVMDGSTGRGENLVLGILAGALAAIIGALLWMGVEMATHMQLGLVAIAIGFLVGWAVRTAGNGQGMIFGIIGAVLTLAGCLGGEILSQVAALASPEHNFVDTLQHLDLSATVTAIFSNMNVISYVIYGIGIYYGYKLSMRK